MTQRLKFGFFILLAGAAWFAPAVKADEWDRLTTLTFNQPVEIPGRVLAAGTYVFKLADSESNRDTVEIFTEDQKQLLAMVLAIPDYREEPTDKTVVTFEERAAGAPEAIHTWFYPGDTTGVEFLYKKPVQQVAANTAEPAQVAAASPAPQPVTPEPPALPQTETESDSESWVPVMMEEDEVIVAQALPPAPSNNASEADRSADATNMPDTLPQTAGNFAIVPLAGMFLLSGGFAALRFAHKLS